MNRRNRTLIVVALAVLLASAASFGVYRAIQSIPVREVQIAKTFAVVASKSVPVGTMLAPEDVKVVPWPTDSQVPGGFSKPEEVVGRGLIQALDENEPVTEPKLAPRSSGAGLASDDSAWHARHGRPGQRHHRRRGFCGARHARGRHRDGEDGQRHDVTCRAEQHSGAVGRHAPRAGEEGQQARAV